MEHLALSCFCFGQHPLPREYKAAVVVEGGVGPAPEHHHVPGLRVRDNVPLLHLGTLIYLQHLF